MKRALVCGGGGFIGSHLVSDLKRRGYWVRAVDLKMTEFSQSDADEFIVADLRCIDRCRDAFSGDFDEVYQLAADMGGAGYLFTTENDADIMHNSIQINLNVVRLCAERPGIKVFYSSSACVFPNITSLIPPIQIALKTALSLLIQIAAMDGKSSSANNFTWHFTVTMG